MSRKSSLKPDCARLEYVLKMIADINTISKRHGSIASALEDTEGHHAIMMCCLQIGEVLNKIETASIRKKLPVSLSYAMRNVIAHDYLGVDPRRIAATIEKDLPKLKSKMESILKRESA